MYIVFAGDFHYPRGGMEDFIDSYSDFDSACIEAKRHEWGQVVLHDTLDVMAEFKKGEKI